MGEGVRVCPLLRRPLSQGDGSPGVPVERASPLPEGRGIAYE
jgi:hypothetical protein